MAPALLSAGRFSSIQEIGAPLAAIVVAPAGCSWERKMNSHMPRFIAIGLLMLTLMTGIAQAAPQRAPVRPSSSAESVDLVALVRDWLVSLFTPRSLAPEPTPTSYAKESGVLDPNGGPH